MDPRSPTFEANLLFKTAPNFTLVNLVEEFRTVLADFDETLLDVEQIDRVFTHLTCTSVDILFAYCEAPLPVEHFLDAQRPTENSFSDAEILARLKSNHASFTVLISDRSLDDKPYGPAQDALKRGISWSLSDCLQSKIFADLVYWSDTDTLYAGEEFDRACTYSGNQDADSNQSSPKVKQWAASPVTGVNSTDLNPHNADVQTIDAKGQINRCDIGSLAPDTGIFRSLAAAANAPGNTASLPLMPWIPMNGMSITCTVATICVMLLPSLHYLLP